MNNRFLFLEEELSVFDAKRQKKKKPGYRAKAKYAMQKGAAAVIAAVGVGWKIFEFAWAQTAGDIRIKLTRMEGSKLPNDDTSLQNRGSWHNKTIRVYRKMETVAGDEISAKFDLKYKYNGYGVGYIDIDHVYSNDAFAWGLDVEAKLMQGPDYNSRNGSHKVSSVELTFNYRFHSNLHNDVIKVSRYKLFGDGRVE